MVNIHTERSLAFQTNPGWPQFFSLSYELTTQESQVEFNLFPEVN
jgi:hypothetical protein